MRKKFKPKQKKSKSMNFNLSTFNNNELNDTTEDLTLATETPAVDSNEDNVEDSSTLLEPSTFDGENDNEDFTPPEPPTFDGDDDSEDFTPPEPPTFEGDNDSDDSAPSEPPTFDGSSDDEDNEHEHRMPPPPMFRAMFGDDKFGHRMWHDDEPLNIVFGKDDDDPNDFDEEEDFDDDEPRPMFIYGGKFDKRVWGEDESDDLILGEDDSDFEVDDDAIFSFNDRVRPSVISENNIFSGNPFEMNNLPQFRAAQSNQSHSTNKS